MLEDRFQNYLNKSYPETDSEVFISENLKFLKNIRENLDNHREFKYYKALSNKLRFEIYKFLQINPMCTCALATLFDKKDNLINHHLKILEKEDLIKGTKEGYFTIYHVIN